MKRYEYPTENIKIKYTTQSHSVEQHIAVPKIRYRHLIFGTAICCSTL